MSDFIKKLKRIWKKVWHFIWEDNSIWSWIVNVILAFIIIKFLVYPGLGLVLGTTHPIVAVVSESMEHNGLPFDLWWEQNRAWYEDNGITREQFREFTLRNGFNKGDIIVLTRANPEKLEIGDVIVFWPENRLESEPIIHRIIDKWEENSNYHFATKGDNNPTLQNFERDIREDQIIGRSLFRIPYLGYVKIFFVDAISIFYSAGR